MSDSTTPPNRSPWRMGALDWLAAGGVMVFFLAPLVFVWFPGGAGKLDSQGWPTFPWDSLAFSLVVAAVAAVVAVAVGTAAAMVLVLTKLPGKNVAATLLLLSFVCPPTVWTLGQLYCYGAGGLVERWWGDGWRPMLNNANAGNFAATIFVLAQVHIPLVMLLVSRGLHRLHHSGFDAARLFLSRRMMWGWLLHAVRLEMMAAFLLVFALALGNFAVPQVLQCRLYPMEIYLQMNNYADRTGAVWLAAPLVVAALLATWAMVRLERIQAFAQADAERLLAPWTIRGWLLLPAAALWLYVLAFTVLPILAMLSECGSWSNFLQAMREAAQETENTLVVGLLVAAVAVLGGWLVARVGVRQKGAAWDMAGMIPLGVPTLVLGLAYVRFYNQFWPHDWTYLGDTRWLLVFGLAARAWPFSTRIASSGYRRLAPEWVEAASLAGMSRWTRFRRISAPLLASDAAAAAVVAFVLSIGDVEISQMLVAPGSGTLSLRLFTYLHFGPMHVTASLAVLQLVLAAAPVFVYFLLTHRSVPVI